MEYKDIIKTIQLQQNLENNIIRQRNMSIAYTMVVAIAVSLNLEIVLQSIFNEPYEMDISWLHSLFTVVIFCTIIWQQSRDLENRKQSDQALTDVETATAFFNRNKIDYDNQQKILEIIKLTNNSILDDYLPYIIENYAVDQSYHETNLMWLKGAICDYQIIEGNPDNTFEDIFNQIEYPTQVDTLLYPQQDSIEPDFYKFYKLLSISVRLKDCFVILTKPEVFNIIYDKSPQEEYENFCPQLKQLKLWILECIAFFPDKLEFYTILAYISILLKDFESYQMQINNLNLRILNILNRDETTNMMDAIRHLEIIKNRFS